MGSLTTLDRALARLPHYQTLLIAVVGVGLLGVADYVTGYEVSMSLLYAGPVALAAWYCGGGSGFGIALLSCVSWYVADLAGGHEYSHDAIRAWNALVRFGFFQLSGGLIVALRRALAGERQRARTDSLTGLMSRLGFEERLEHDLALAQRLGGAMTVACIDLDGFKAVNDTHGHAAGDRVLQTLGQVIGGVIRRVDTGARLGGDEFALILPDTDEAGAREFVSRMEADLQAALAATPSPVSCSIGVVTYIRPESSVAEVVAQADALMYEVKRQGKGAAAYRLVSR